ncbi:hypothetical protein JCGZ_02531 [Jatropha curcas]|uniref:Uncharacterized protein n=1 Tax=Jatropha curcas TaxID=180498 RepID=A0A067JFM7_JATCU|nr:hypothetical protein JCGZ_02531 [Jatropha curcas]
MDTHRMMYHRRRETFIGRISKAFCMGRGYYNYAKSGTGEIVRSPQNYSTARKRVISSQSGSEVESRIDELALYLEDVGGEKKRKVYGIRSQASQFYCG